MHLPFFPSFLPSFLLPIRPSWLAHRPFPAHGHPPGPTPAHGVPRSHKIPGRIETDRVSLLFICRNPIFLTEFLPVHFPRVWGGEEEGVRRKGGERGEGRGESLFFPWKKSFGGIVAVQSGYGCAMPSARTGEGRRGEREREERPAEGHLTKEWEGEDSLRTPKEEADFYFFVFC